MWVFCNSPNMTTQTGTWTNLILSGWQTRFITISTAVVRFCVTTQLVALCLILATLALEHGSVQGEDADRMSILQHDTSGPTDIASSYLTKLKSGKISIGMITVFVLVAESTLVQFASTFLISDFKMYNLDSQLQNRYVLLHVSRQGRV